MLRLLLGSDWVANRNEILGRICAQVHAGRDRQILMVPELISHDTERRIAVAVGDSASRYVEVLPFTRLARRVAEESCNAAVECLDNGGRVVAMAAAVRQLHSKRKAYAAVETRPEFLTELLSAVDEFKRCCITSQDLQAAARLTQGSLAQKLEELSLLVEAYDGLCSRGKRDPSDQMTWLLEQLMAGDFAQRHVFYIDGFPDFTRQHMAILEHLIGSAECVTVSLTCTRPDDGIMSFEKAGHTAMELIRSAERMGVAVEIVTVEPAYCPVASVRERLFQGKTEYLPELAGRLQLLRTDSVYKECQLAAQQVLKLVRGGCRYRDIVLVCGDMAVYRDTLNLVFRRSQIPLYLSGKEDILGKSVIATVLSALEAALGGFEQEAVLRYCKSVLSPLDTDSCDKLENYVYVWGISGSRWHTAWSGHPDGLGQTWTPEAQEALAQLNAARALAVEPLLQLARGFREAACVRQQVLTLYSFLEEIRLAQRLDELAQYFDARQDNRNAQILNQLWEILLTALEQLHDVLGETVWDGEVFTRLLTLLLSQYDVGTIPPVLDAVMAGPVSAMRCQEEKHLLVLGAEEGSLPGYSGSQGVLTEQERLTLRQLGVPLTGGSLDGIQAEYAEIYGVFCGARETVTLLCSGEQPSYVYQRLSRLVGGDAPAVPELAALATVPEEAAAYLAARSASQEAAALDLQRLYQRITQCRDHQLGDLSPASVRTLYGKRLRLSASQVDCQANCRLSYFLKYGMRLRERREATMDAAEFGTYVHWVLEHTARAVMEAGGFHTVTLEETLTLARGFSDTYLHTCLDNMESARAAYLLQRNLQELEMIVGELWQELHTAKFLPTAFELAFGDGKEMPAITIPASMEAQLRGFVDRVDIWQQEDRCYFRVVDYKTGKKDFDYCDVFNGLGLQMLLYLFALEDGGQNILGQKRLAAGVQYFSARSPVITADGRLTPEEAEAERGKKWKRKGLVLSDEAVLDAMEPEGAACRLSCSRKKDGSITGDVASREDLQRLKTYVFSLLRKLVDDIASGNVTPNPYTRGSAHNACTYCPYQGICHPETVEGRRNYKTMSADRFWQEIGREAENG